MYGWLGLGATLALIGAFLLGDHMGASRERDRCKANTGDWAGACKELDRWVYAKGIKLNGLVKRRAAERAMCEGRSSKASQSMSVGSG